MSEAHDPDALLAARFAREHTQVAAEPFVATTLHAIRTRQQRANSLHLAVRSVALLMLIAASPWLIAGVERLNAALEFSLQWTADQPVAWVSAALGAGILISIGLLRRR